MLEEPAPAFAQKAQDEHGVARQQFEQRVRHLDPAGRDEAGAEIVSSLGHSALLRQVGDCKRSSAGYCALLIVSKYLVILQSTFGITCNDHTSLFFTVVNKRYTREAEIGRISDNWSLPELGTTLASLPQEQCGRLGVAGRTKDREGRRRVASTLGISVPRTFAKPTCTRGSVVEALGFRPDRRGNPAAAHRVAPTRRSKCPH